MQDTLHEIGLRVLEYWFLLGMVINTVLMVMFRTAKNNGKVDWLEAGMCACLTYGIWFALSWFQLPQELGVLIGGFVGFFGTSKIGIWVSNKFGLDQEEK